MKEKIKLPLLILLVSFLVGYGQSKMLVGKNHTIFVDMPDNWLQAPNDQTPFFIKPDEKNVSENTYMYVYGIDYDINPNLIEWIKGNNGYQSKNFKGLKIDSLTIPFDNLKKSDYLTGRYKTITYEYESNRMEVLLIIECKNTITTAVLSVNNRKEYEKYLNSFKEMAKSLKILQSTSKKE